MAGFSLAGLLRLRRLQEEQAAAEVARAHVEHRSAQLRRQATAELLAGSAMPQRGSGGDFGAAVAGRAALTGMVGEASLLVQGAEGRVDAVTLAWSATRTRATTLAKLEERHVAAQRTELDRLEQLVIDEAAARRRARPTEGDQ